MKKVALITGVTGQDGSYLSELLLSYDYEVHGIVRRSSVFTTERIDHLIGHSNFYLHHGDLTYSSNLTEIVKRVSPSEVYHLAAQSHVGVSFEVPEYTGNVTGIGTLRLLSAVKTFASDAKIYNAATSEMFGGIELSAPQSEITPFFPKSPYAAAKLYSYWLAVNYRESFNMFCANGILFNHESPRRGATFVTRKTSKAVASYVQNKDSVLRVGNLDATRDWGFAGDYVQAMWKMLQVETPADFVIATGIPCTVRTFITKAYESAGVVIGWEGYGQSEVARDLATGRIVVEVDSRYFRPTEVEYLLGDAAKAHEVLHWKPTVDLDSLIQMMVNSDMKHNKV